MDTATERRRFERFENDNLQLSVHRPGIKGILRINPTAECLNFSLTGLQFGTEQQLNVGEKLVIDLVVSDIEVTEIPCEVKSCKSEDDVFCCGIQFDMNEKRMQTQDVMHALLRIEDRLRSFQTYR